MSFLILIDPVSGQKSPDPDPQPRYICEENVTVDYYYFHLDKSSHRTRRYNGPGLSF